MSKRRIILISILYIILLTIINFGVILSATLIFNYNNVLEIGTNEYINELSKFINKNQIWIVLSSTCFWIPYFYKLIKNKDIRLKISHLNKIYIYLIFAFIFSVLWNIIIFYLGLSQIKVTSISFSYLLATSFIGPILEEFVFRGIIYNKLKKVFSIKKSIILISLFFSIYHLNVIQGIYVFFFSILLTYIYEKYNNLLHPIIIHCVINFSSAVLVPIILSSNYLFVIFIILIILGIGTILYIYYNKKLILSAKES